MSRSTMAGRPVVAGARPQPVQRFAASSMPFIPSRNLVVRRFKDDDNGNSSSSLKEKLEKGLESVTGKADKVASQASQQVDKVAGQASQQQGQRSAFETHGANGAGEAKDHEQTRVAAQTKGTDPEGYNAPAFLPALTRRREAWISRIAMLGFFGVSVVELITPGHPGVLTQLANVTGLDRSSTALLLNFFIAFNAYALLPFSPTFSPENQKDLNKRPHGPPFNIPHGGGLGAVLGTSGFGFTKRNEIYNGRLSMLAFAWALTGDFATGGLGPIAQLGRNLGMDITESTYWDVTKGWTLAAVIVLGLAYGWGSHFQKPTEKENEIY